MPDGFGTPPHIQPGPCVLCGAADYPLSTGGPSICCLCDCTPAQGRVRQLGEENRQLRARIAELEAAALAACQQASNELHYLTGD